MQYVQGKVDNGNSMFYPLLQSVILLGEKVNIKRGVRIEVSFGDTNTAHVVL